MKKIFRGSWWKVAAAASAVSAILVAGGAGTFWN